MRNGFNNFNFCFILALLFLGFLPIARRKYAPDMLIVISPLYIWLGFMSLQPHKEERYDLCCWCWKSLSNCVSFCIKEWYGSGCFMQILLGCFIQIDNSVILFAIWKFDLNNDLFLSNSEICCYVSLLHLGSCVLLGLVIFFLLRLLYSYDIIVLVYLGFSFSLVCGLCIANYIAFVAIKSGVVNLILEVTTPLICVICAMLLYLYLTVLGFTLNLRAKLARRVNLYFPFLKYR